MTAGPEPREHAPPDSEDAIREAAEQHLRALAGPHARLRADQWTAIKALVVDRRRALVVQRTGWGNPPFISLPRRCCASGARDRR